MEQGAPIAADLKLTVAPFDGSSEVVAWWTAVAARLEAVGLPLEGEGAETWGARLKIGKKGGGEHFDESQRRDADAAYGRVGALYEYASLSSQLREKAEQLSRMRGGAGVQKEMSRLKRLERFATLQSQAIALATRVTEGRVAAERSYRRRAARDARRIRGRRVGGAARCCVMRSRSLPTITIRGARRRPPPRSGSRRRIATPSSAPSSPSRPN